MKKIFYATVCMAILISGQAKAQQPTTAFDMSNYLTNIVMSLYEAGGKWGTAHTKANQTGDYSKLAPIRKKLEKLINEKQAELSTINDVSDSKDFREAIVAFLANEKKMIKDGFIPFESLSKNSPPADIEKAEKNLKTLAAKEGTQLEKIRKTQAEYAKNNHFIVNDKKAGKK